MPEVRTLSFRDQTMGGVHDLLADEGLTCAHSQQIIGYLAGELLDYREEGVALAPVILFCQSVSEALQSFPGSTHYQIGTAQLDVGFARKVLKDCASLATKSWFIYIERADSEKMNYGVATFESLPGSINIVDGVQLSSHTLAVVLKKTGSKTVKVIGSRGSQLTCLFSTSRGEATDLTAVRDFGEICCAGHEDDESREEFSRYFVGTLDSLLQASHGCILVCSDTIPISQIADLADSTLLDPPIDLYSALMAFKADPSAGNLASLQSYYGLIEGFVRSDGMVIFDSKGRVTAFRTFYRPTDGGQAQVSVVGGARRRAFEGACTHVGQELSGVLFRSQDGLTLFKGAEE